MKNLLVLFLVFGMVFFSCDDDPDPIEDQFIPQDFDVPELTQEFISIMSQTDVARFELGPGEAYMRKVYDKYNGEYGDAEWHPMLMLFTFEVQLSPLYGTSCEPGNYISCFAEGADPFNISDCLENKVGESGLITSIGTMSESPIYAEYYPIFCLPDYEGHGTGFYEIGDDKLWIEAQSGPFERDQMTGTTKYYRWADYDANLSTGQFLDAIGWETSIISTYYGNYPANNQNGIGSSNAVIFGWVFW